jgi:hypothetical protein
MSPAEWEDAMARLCLDRDGAQVAAELPGDPARWVLYRDMVRHRMVRESADALPRLRATMSARQWEELVADALAARVTQSRFFREMPLELAAFASGRRDLDTHALAVDVAAIEVRDAADGCGTPADDVALDGTTGPTPTLRVVSSGERATLVWRNLRTLRAGVLDVAPWFARWVQACADDPGAAQPSLAASVAGLAEADVVGRLQAWSGWMAQLVELGGIEQIGVAESN